MKTRNLIIGTFVALTTIFFTSCEDTGVQPEGKEYGILPERFKVDIPGSLTESGTKSTLKSTETDTLSGNEIYQHLTNFIAIGEAGADLVEDIIWGITVHHIDQVKTITYVSDDDNRIKNLVVNEGVEYSDRIWEYQLTVTDANADGGIGMQVFWNKSPIAGIAIIKPRNINHNDRNTGEGIFSIEYSEEGTEDYEAYMIIEVANLPLSDVDPFAADNLKMFVGKNGDQIDVYGNSNHPNAKFNYNEEETSGFNWAFVASGFDSEDIAVAEVGLPASGAELSTRIEILEDNSMQKVLSREFTNYIVTEYPQLEGHEDLVAAYLAPYLSNTEAPGFFGEGGFVQAGTAPNEKYAELITSIESLTPFNPKSISELSIEFK